MSNNLVKNVAVFCNARDEKHIREWAAHHLLIGFNRIIIFDHNSKVPLSTVFQNFDKRVAIIRYNTPQSQNNVKIHLMKRPSQSPQLPLVKKKKLRIAIPEIESYADYEDSERSIDPRAISPEFEYVPRDQIPLNRRESLLPPLVL
jgi:hypothetical protein